MPASLLSFRSVFCVASLAAATLSCACSGGASSSPAAEGGTEGEHGGGGSNSNTPGAPSGGFSLTVTKAVTTSSLRGDLPASGDVYLVVDVTLQNDSVSTPLSVSFGFFSVSTSSSLVVEASAVTSLISNPCRPDVSVASGGATTCELLFELSLSDTATTLRYDDTQGDVARAAIPADPSASAACEAVGGWSHMSSSACSSCVMKNCYGAESTVLPPCDAAQACQSSCATCGCLEACEPTSDCRAAYDAMLTCMSKRCAAECQ